jgi:predicted MPP superfamily phosphohydrolase
MGLYWRARQNAERILVKRNDVKFADLRPAFDGFTILHISDLHVDMNKVAMQHLIELVGGMQYDQCVLTGDYRGKLSGPWRRYFGWPGKSAGSAPWIDLCSARQPRFNSNGSGDTSEVYRQAAHANFNLMLSGHTHGGQLCLPGSIPIKLEAVLPRRMGAGTWKYHNMTGYTSVGAGSSVLPVRLNCPPEITLHCLRRAR